MIWIDFNLGKCFKKIVTMVEVVISNYLKFCNLLKRINGLNRLLLLSDKWIKWIK